METLWRQFVNPPKGYGTIPWWIWNGRMENAEMERQLRLMKGAGLDGWMLWVRFGVEVEYLSQEFFSRLRFAVQRSAELGLDVWIFDEYAWPSGTAHNLVSKNHPEYRMRVLSCIEAKVSGLKQLSLCFPLPSTPIDVVRVSPGPQGVYVEGELPQDERRIERVIALRVANGRIDLSSAVNITGAVSGFDLFWEAPEGDWLVLVLISRDYRNYIDAVNPDAVRAFIRYTHEQYKRHIGHYFGKVVKGFFLDEPRYIRHGKEKPQFEEPTIPWSQRLFERLEERGLKPIEPYLAAVFCEVEGKDRSCAADKAACAMVEGKDAVLRVRFWKALMELYKEAYFKQLSDWAEKHGMVYSGDCFTEESEILVNQGDYFWTASPLHIPGMDSLGDVQLDNPVVRKGPKFPSSLAHSKAKAELGTQKAEGATRTQHASCITHHASEPQPFGGRCSALQKRCMAEGPGLLGWDCTLQRLKACTDWLYAYGINMLVPNAFFYTIAHEQFYETPSYFFQWTLWPYYHIYDAYVRRLSFLLSQGNHVADLAFFYPTATFLKNYRPLPTALRLHRGPFAGASEEMQIVERGCTAIADSLLKEQIDFDYLHENALSEAMVEECLLHLGNESFSCLLMPPATTMGKAAFEKIGEFFSKGGKLICVGLLPTMLYDAPESQEASAFFEGLVAASPDNFSFVPLPEAPSLTTNLAAFRATLRQTIEKHIQPRIKIEAQPTKDHFAYHMRRAGEADIYFIANLSPQTQDAKIALRSEGKVEVWNPVTSEREELPAQVSDGEVRFDYRFAPNESLTVIVDTRVRGKEWRMTRESGAKCASSVVALPFSDEWDFEILDDNLYLPPKILCESEWTVRRSWEGMAVYRFSFPLRIGAVLERLILLIDHVQTQWRLGRFRVFVNGKPLPVIPNESLDRELLECNLLEAVCVGQNKVLLEYDYTDYADIAFDLHSKRTAPPVVPKVRVMGKFKLQRNTDNATHITDHASSDTDWLLVPSRKEKVKAVSWTELGYPFYSGRAIYRQTFELGDEFVGGSASLEFEGIAEVARVFINGKKAGALPWPPWRVEVGGLLKCGQNTIEIEVTNTQANQMYEQPKPSGLLGGVRIALLTQ